MDDLLRMAGCGLAVAAVAGPVALAAWVIARRAGTPLLPPPNGWRVSWTGFEVLVAFVVVSGVMPALAVVVVGGAGLVPVPAGPPEGRAGAAGPLTLWAAVLAFPVQLGLLWATTRTAFARWRPAGERRPAAARAAAGVLVWAGLAPVVTLVHAGTGWLFWSLDWAIDEHPLARLAAGSDVERALFVVQAAVAAPVVEELLFRGVLLGWLVGGRSLTRPTGRPSADRRVWWVLAVGLVVAAASVWGERNWLGGPVVFAAALAAGWAVLRVVVRRKRRAAGAVYASAALFALVHSAVWPSPIPLFLLGLGLGWLALRTRGVLAPVIVHGLFNTVSVVFVLAA